MVIMPGKGKEARSSLYRRNQLSPAQPPRGHGRREGRREGLRGR